MAGGGKAIFVDTEGTFRPERIVDIAERFNLDGSLVLENITVAKAHNVELQFEFLKQAAALMLSDKYCIISKF